MKMRVAALSAFRVTPLAIASLWSIIALTLPLAIKVYFPAIGLELVFPTEPLLALLALYYTYRFIMWLRSKATWPTAALSGSDVTVMIYVVSIIIATAFANEKLVAVKALIAQLIQIGLFYGVPRALCNEPGVSPTRWFTLCAFGLIPVIFLAFVQQGLYGLDRNGSHHAAFPFYTDHTGYSAALGFALPWFLGLALQAWSTQRSPSKAAFYLVAGCLALIALVLTHSRGGWVGALAGTLLVSFVLRDRWYGRTGLVVALFSVGSLAVMGYAHHRSSAAEQRPGVGIMDSIRSITDVKHDPSNMDRIRRWKAAWAMFVDDPMTGVGPGNYQYMLKEFPDPTTSVVRPIKGPIPDSLIRPMWHAGNAVMIRDHAQRSPTSGGTAHSEYFLALSELGAIGLLAFIAIVAQVVLHALRWRVAWRTPMAIGILFGLVAYMVHGLFNNFLDDPKLGLPFWAGLALAGQVMNTRRSAVPDASP